MVSRNELNVILEVLDAATSLDDLQGTVEKIRTTFAVDHVMYHWVDSAGDHYYFGTYSPEWATRYQEMNYVRIDPVVAGCYRGFHPVDWKRLDWSSKHAREFLNDAIAHGVGNQGYSIPVRGPNGQFALATVSHNCDDETWSAFIAKFSHDLILLAHYFNRKALELEPERAGERPKTLSPREVDVMTLLALGYSRAQVAETLSISQHTLRVYVESARFKLGAANTTSAIAKATAFGLIII
jgi:DNA-binding CsgD family transcriptional regulator